MSRADLLTIAQLETTTASQALKGFKSTLRMRKGLNTSMMRGAMKGTLVDDLVRRTGMASMLSLHHPFTVTQDKMESTYMYGNDQV